MRSAAAGAPEPEQVLLLICSYFSAVQSKVRECWRGQNRTHARAFPSI